MSYKILENSSNTLLHRVFLSFFVSNSHTPSSRQNRYCNVYATQQLVSFNPNYPHPSRIHSVMHPHPLCYSQRIRMVRARSERVENLSTTRLFSPSAPGRHSVAGLVHCLLSIASFLVNAFPACGQFQNWSKIPFSNWSANCQTDLLSQTKQWLKTYRDWNDD